MPSASGVYSLPSGYLAVTGTPILASQHNPPLEDIAAALTLRLSRDGTAPMTGGIKGIAGSAALPSYAYATDPTTGTFKTTNGLGIAVAGTQVAEFTAAGLASGVWYPGMMLPWTRLTVPNSLWVFPVGQTLSRTTYPTLWAAAQVEIAAGNAFFNNGDGSTTFGIGDARGRTIAGPDVMGGSADALRLVGTTQPLTSRGLGGVGGEATHPLTAAEIPTISSSGTTSNSITVSAGGFIPLANTSAFSNFQTSGSGSTINLPGVPLGGSNSWIGSTASLSGSNNISASVSSSNTGGAAHNNLPPILLCNFILFAGA